MKKLFLIIVIIFMIFIVGLLVTIRIRHGGGRPFEDRSSSPMLPSSALEIVSMLSALSGTIINRSQVGRSLDTSEKAIRDYLQIAEGSYIWRNFPSYEKSTSKSVVKMPKGNIRDSGLSNFIQGITKREQLLNYPNVGAAFEAFIAEEIIKGVQATDVVNLKHYYFRTRNGAEIDMILEGPFGTLPIEIKIGSSIKQRQIQTLKNFVYNNNLPVGIVINNSDDVRLVADRIIQLPATCI